MRIFLISLLLCLVCACSLPQIKPTESFSGYRGSLFQFEYPPGWQVKEGSLSTGKNAPNYFNLNLTIQVQVHQGNLSTYATVSRREIPKVSSLQMEFDQTYAAIASQVRNVKTGESTMDGRKALVREYDRPWGEPWRHFKDVWIEKDGWAYVVSLVCGLNPKPEELSLLDKMTSTFHLR